jgi:hypothetical protein
MLNNSISFADSQLVPLESSGKGIGLVLGSVALGESNEQPSIQPAATTPTASQPGSPDPAVSAAATTEQAASAPETAPGAADGTAPAHPVGDSTVVVETGVEPASPTDPLIDIAEIQTPQPPGVTIAQLTEGEIYFSMALGQADNAKEVVEIANWQEVFGTGADSAMLYHATHHH